MDYQLPDTVMKALGPEATRDLSAWLKDFYKKITTQVNLPISAFVAKQKVNGLIGDQVSDIMIAGDPEMTQLPGGKFMWRVPIYLTYQSKGWVGPVGVIEVDAKLGEIQYTEEDLERIVAEADRLASGLFPNSPT